MASGRASAWAFRMILTWWPPRASWPRPGRPWDLAWTGADTGCALPNARHGPRLARAALLTRCPTAPRRSLSTSRSTTPGAGFKLLGGSVGGDLEFDIDVEAVGLAPARKRAARATQLAARIEQFVTASPTPQAAHHAWFLVSKCCAHALSFDSRLVPSGALAAVEEPVWAAVRSTVSAVLPVTPNADAARRMQLAGNYTAGAAYAARRRAATPTARTILGLGHERAEGAHDSGGTGTASSGRSSWCGERG